MVMQAGHEGHKERLRQKFAQDGLAGMLDYEILELLLGFIIVRKDTKPIAKTMIQRFGSISGVIDAPLDELQKIDGLGDRSCELIAFLKQLVTYYLREKTVSSAYSCNSPQSVVDYFISFYGGKPFEEFAAVFLASDNAVIAVETYQSGTVNYSHVYPRNLIADMFRHNAVGLILVHNHPSGALEPSKADIALTRSMKELCDRLSLNLLDHIIIAGKSFTSLKECGYC